MSKKLSIIVPVFNERPFIHECISKLGKVCQTLPLSLEIIAVDDGSTDGTREVLAELENDFDFFRAVYQDQNCGKGAALQRGISEASGEFILFQDADMEYDPADIPAVLKPLLDGLADVVYGSRFTISPARKILNYHHQAGNKFLTFLSNLATGLNLTDMETGYKAFRADVLKTIPFRSCRFGIEPEITAKVAKRHCTIYEVPVSYNGRSYGEGKKITWKDGFAAIYTILKFWLIDDCYQKDQILNSYDDLEFTHHAQKRLVLGVWPYLGDNIIEIGSGIGSISRILPIREKITLTESRKELLDLLDKGFEGKNRMEVAHLNIEEKPPTEMISNFDTAIFLNQLQFFQDEKMILDNLHSLLKDKGRLLISVPGHQEMGSYERKLGYLRRYSEKSAIDLVEKSGFRVLSTFQSNYPALIIWKYLIKKADREELPLVFAKIADTLVNKLAFWEKNLKLPGLTQVVVAEKVSQ